MNKIFYIFTDGGARGNPGPAALGVYIEDDKGGQIVKIGKKLGVQTNNFAEYQAVLEGLNYILNNKKIFDEAKSLEFLMDSNLVASQLNGLFKVKNSAIRSMVFQIREKEQAIAKKITYSHIPREENTQADKLVNMALDNHI